MTEEKYLELVIEGLNGAIEELNERLGTSEKDINTLKELYWENVSDFDEFGYEEFENRQQIQTRVNSKSDYIRTLYQYEKMKDSPYFARVDFIFEGEDEPESCYIGIGNFSKNKGGLPLVYDWRAPISSLFYDYDKGPASYEAPSGTIHGEVTGKYQYKIKKGKLLYSIESDIKIDDDILKQALSLNADARLKNIVSTIQREQNAIIRNEKDKILIVQGGAGSGKTSVALHRIAYLLYHHRNEMKASQVLILSPNDVFADYISHILPELGEENISEMTFDEFAKKELSQIAAFESHYDFLDRVLSHERSPKSKKKQELLSYRGSMEFAQEINAFVLSLEYDIVDFRDFKFKKMEKSADDIAELFYDKLPDIPLFKRMDAVCDYVIDEYETLTDKDLDDLELAIVKSKFDNMYRTKDVLAIYSEFLESIGEKKLNLENRYVGYEDAYPLLYLKYLLYGPGATRRVKHLIIDEMQDYSYMQYCIIGWIFKCPMTILGDREQTVDTEKSDVLKFLPGILGKNARTIVLKKSYRSTVEISSFAAGIAGITDTEFFERHGDAPSIDTFTDESTMYDALAANVKKQLATAGMETVAVLTKTATEAQYAAQMLEGKVEFTVLDKNTDRFKPGLVIAPFYLAKGLEFDGVHIINADDREYYSDYHRQILYIDATRALHCLNIYAVGAVSTLLQ